jgi:hypothetical protein
MKQVSFKPALLLIFDFAIYNFELNLAGDVGAQRQKI